MWSAKPYSPCSPPLDNTSIQDLLAVAPHTVDKTKHGACRPQWKSSNWHRTPDKRLLNDGATSATLPHHSARVWVPGDLHASKSRCPYLRGGWIQFLESHYQIEITRGPQRIQCYMHCPPVTQTDVWPPQDQEVWDQEDWPNLNLHCHGV